MYIDLFVTYIAVTQHIISLEMRQQFFFGIDYEIKANPTPNRTYWLFNGEHLLRWWLLMSTDRQIVRCVIRIATHRHLDRSSFDI